MELGIVADDVDVPIESQPFAQVVEVRDEQLRVTPRSGLADQQLAGPPVQRLGHAPLQVRARRFHLGLLAATRPDLGIGVNIDLVLNRGGLAGGRRGQQTGMAPSFGVYCGSLGPSDANAIFWFKHGPQF